MTLLSDLAKHGFQLAEEYYYDANHHSSVLFSDDIYVILDHDLCDSKDEDTCFDYSKYCEMQNKWMEKAGKLYRFYVTGDENISQEILKWIGYQAESIEVKDDGGSFDKSHIDNTPLEKVFEDLFIEAYGYDALNYLQKEYSLSLEAGRNGFVDYVIETDTGNYAIEENGVRYHHPQLVTKDTYQKQLEKQNTLSVFGFKTYRFSYENLNEFSVITEENDSISLLFNTEISILEQLSEHIHDAVREINIAVPFYDPCLEALQEIRKRFNCHKRLNVTLVYLLAKHYLYIYQFQQKNSQRTVYRIM